MTKADESGDAHPAGHPDGKRSKLRGLSTRIEAELAALTADGAEATPEVARLQAAWLEMVQALDLGPEPKTRICPSCKGVGLLKAARCGYCWKWLPSHA